MDTYYSINIFWIKLYNGNNSSNKDSIEGLRSSLAQQRRMEFNPWNKEAQMLHMLSVLPEAQLPADHLGTEVCPAIIAHCAPDSVVINFYSAFTGAVATSQPDSALCKGWENGRWALSRGEKKQPVPHCWSVGAAREWKKPKTGYP